MKSILKSINRFGRTIVVFGALVILACVSLIPLTQEPAHADTGGYPWSAATYVDANYDWGYSTCPSNDSGCMSFFGYLSGVKYGESDPWREYLRNCTSYVSWQISQVFNKSLYDYGNADQYASAAASAGYTVTAGSSTTPQTGEIAEWGSEVGGGYGHVAYVSGINSSGYAELAEYNVAGTGVYTDNRTTASSSAGTPDNYIKIGTLSANTGVSGSSSDGNVASLINMTSTNPTREALQLIHPAMWLKHGTRPVTPAGTTAVLPAWAQRCQT